MLRILPRSEGNIVGVECSKKVTHEDYQKILIPTLNRVIAEHGKIRTLIDFADDFSGYESKAIVDDTIYGFKHMKNFEKIAVINPPAIVGFLMKVFDKLTKTKCRSFEKKATDEAWGWIEG